MRKRSTVPTTLYSADDARIIAPRATELHALRSAIPTGHAVMMGPWVPPPTSRAPAMPNNVGNTGPHSAGSHTEYRPQWPADGRPSPTPWMGLGGVRSVRGLPTERKPVDLAKHGGDSGGFGLRLDGVEPLVGIVAAEGRQTGFDCPLGRFRPSDRF